MENSNADPLVLGLIWALVIVGLIMLVIFG